VTAAADDEEGLAVAAAGEQGKSRRPASGLWTQDIDGGADEDGSRLRRLRVRARWLLAYTVHRNPGLAALRSRKASREGAGALTGTAAAGEVGARTAAALRDAGCDKVLPFDGGSDADGGGDDNGRK
jgi:hypothetical protein